MPWDWCIYLVEHQWKSFGIWASIKKTTRSWQLKYLFLLTPNPWGNDPIWQTTNYIVFPRHLGPPAFGRYLDPPNIPKTCSQKIVGCLGALGFPRCSLNEEINSCHLKAFEFLMSDPVCLYKRQLFWLVTSFVIYLNFACCSSTMIFLRSSFFQHQLFQLFCLFIFREEAIFAEINRRKDRAFLDELGELGAAMNSAKAPTATPLKKKNLSNLHWKNIKGWLAK